MQFSFSNMSIFKTCPQRFYLQYIRKVPKIEKYSEALDIGKKVHSVMEKTFEYAASMPIMDAYEKALSEQSDVADLLQYFDPHVVFKDSVLRSGASELKIGITRDLKPTDFFNADLRGVFDLVWITDELNILDFKSNQLKNADIEQLEFYAVLGYHYYKHFWSVPKVNVFFYYLKHEDPWYFASYTKAEVENLTEKFLSLIEQIEKEQNFPAKPGSHCSYCPVAHYCPEAQNEEQIQAQELSDEELLKKYLAVKATYELLETELRDRLEKREIVTPNYRAYYQKVEKKVIDPEYAKVVLKTAQVKLDELLDVINFSQALFKKFGINLPKEAFIAKEEFRLKIEELGQ